MSGTRNLNTKNDYLCEKKSKQKYSNYTLDNVYAEQPGTNRMFSIGGNVRMYSGNLSHNSVDIESKLRGINSVNLEGPSFDPILRSKQIQSVDLFDNNLKKEVYLPSPIIHYSNERPGFYNL